MSNTMHSRVTKAIGARLVQPVSRWRVLNACGVEPASKVTVLQAPAGFGKTECLAQWHSVLQARGVRCARVRLTTSDDDLRQLLEAMISALAALGLTAPEIGQPEVSGRDAFCRAALSTIANVLGTTSRPVVVLVDDAHRVHSSEALRAFELLLQRTPGHVRYILATRYRPLLSLARIATEGGLARVSKQSLLFTHEETLLALDGLADPAEATEIHALTCGWPGLIASIASDLECPGLLSSLHQGRPRGAIAALLESVFSAAQAEPLPDFLAEMAVNESFNAPLAAAVTGRDDAEALIEAALHAGVPLLLQEQTQKLRYPPVLQRWLIAGLQARSPDSLLALRARGAHALAGTGGRAEASAQILAGPLIGVEDRSLLESCGSSLLWHVGPQVLAEYPLPRDACSQFPRLARAHSLARQFAGFDGNGVDLGDLQNAGASRVAGLPEHFPPTVGLSAAIGAFESEENRHAEALALAACEDFSARGLHFGAYIARMYCGFAAARAGQWLPAMDHFQACLIRATTEQLGERPLYWTRGCIRELLSGLRPVESISPGYEGANAATAANTWPLPFTAWIKVQYRESLARGDRAGAKDILVDGAAVARARAWRRAAVELECAVLDHTAHFDESGGLSSRLDALNVEARDLRSAHLARCVSLCAVRVHIRCSELTQALSRIADMPDTAESSQTPEAICAQFLRLGLGLISGNSLNWSEETSRFLSLAAACPCTELLANDVPLLLQHIPLDDGKKRLRTLVAQLNELSHAMFCRTTRQSRPAEAPKLALSPRERDVLDLLGSGMSQREIGEFLGVSESSVKSYQTTLFRKLNATRRSDAIKEATRRGLLRGLGPS